MMFFILLIGALLVITAWNNTHGQLAQALQKDVPGFLKWALAIFAIIAIGWIPGMKPVSRWLLALVLVVIVVANYKTILAGLSSFTGTAAPAVAGDAGNVAPDPTSTGATGPQTHAELSGTAVIANNAPPAPPNPFDPATYTGMFLPSTSGFGGHA